MFASSVNLRGVVGWVKCADGMRPTPLCGLTWYWILTPDGDGRSCVGAVSRTIGRSNIGRGTAIEAFNVLVLHWPARLDQNMPDYIALRPCHKGPTGQLRGVVSSYRLQAAPEDCSAIQQPSHLLSRNAMVGRGVHALTAQVIGHRQEFDAASISQAVAHEIHTPNLVDWFVDLTPSLYL